jgi:hypothetical protein
MTNDELKASLWEDLCNKQGHSADVGAVLVYEVDFYEQLEHYAAERIKDIRYKLVALLIADLKESISKDHHDLSLRDPDNPKKD